MDAASEIQQILQERGDSYSDKTFPAIARQWSAYLSTREDTDITLLPEDVARMMALFKIARVIANTDFSQCVDPDPDFLGNVYEEYPESLIDDSLDAASYLCLAYDCQKDNIEAVNKKVISMSDYLEEFEQDEP
jgi:hypothetical protein|nr:MAG TPA: hypothetical protein [Caudoviricetes sp.]